MDVQGSLFADLETDGPTVRPLTGAVERRALGRGAWLDIRRDFVGGGLEVFEAMRDRVPWHSERRQMYDAMVAVPRLLHTYGAGEPLPVPALSEAREALSAYYADELGEPFVTAGCCFYRTGADSVAWHGDTIGRGATHDTMVAICSFGDTRRLALRPRGGGASISVTMADGDLVVMGGSCQRTWEHAVPKVASAGPRISVQFRPAGVS